MMKQKEMGMDEELCIARKNRIIDRVIFAGMLLAVSAVTLTLFYRQCTGSPQMYHSDMKAYILEMQGLDSGYSFPYPVLFKLSAFFDLFLSPEMAVAVATMVLNSGAMVVTKLAFNRLVLARNHISSMSLSEKKDSCSEKCIMDDKYGWLYGMFISMVAISLFFIAMLYTPAGIYLPGVKFRYLGVFTANPFHNATYMAARPFAILAFLWFVKLLPVYEQGISLKNGWKGESGAEVPKEHVALGDYIWFSIFLLLATMTKPSFTLIMVSTAGLVMLYRMIRSGFKNFVPTIQLGICFIPTFIDLLYQYQGVFVSTGTEEGGVGFSFGDVWSLYNGCIPLAVCLAVGFPILVLVLNFRKYRKSTLYLFSWQLFVVSFLEAFLLFEKGFRKPDFNFSWGYMYGIFFCHFGALAMLTNCTKEYWRGKISNAEAGSVEPGSTESVGKPGKMERVLLTVQWLAYFCHLICGLLYFKGIFAGGMYY